ncbi:hypothetical protein TNIN_99361 [Trichonephila inaurata madagascariensis]|uniref:Uncharacterized protein n=1 Tax=Trichonephila inaurata madagascariensis TaxID=2747483 RepID=A0A8X6IW10_9ARAC|nr:hypothetical protein TNIN_99361 [Trichonephila inaurata madagascariensis]
MTVSWILEGVFYFLPFILAILTQGNLPNLIQILAYATIGEFLKYYLLLKHGVRPGSCVESLPLNLNQPNSERKMIPIVHSLMVFKICEALDIQVEFSPKENQNDFKKPENQVGYRFNIPTVQSEKIYLLPKELNLKANLSLKNDSNNFTPQVEHASMNIKPPVVVNNLIVYKMSQALGFNTKLNPVQYSEPFVAKHRKKRLERKIPAVKSPEILKFCEALGIQVRLASP